ncbi:hypothetical protein [Streptomyces sp. NPDC001828]|uniref:hypothetical protein n=1 Tax=Streptomyces sp. NPDC001828 TaxID=3364615 RepID=UPI0036AFBA17
MMPEPVTAVVGGVRAAQVGTVRSVQSGGPARACCAEGEGEVEAVDLTSPVLGDGAFTAGEEALLQFVQAGSIFGLMLSIGQRMQASLTYI